jgi:hypothetical protein
VALPLPIGGVSSIGGCTRLDDKGTFLTTTKQESLLHPRVLFNIQGRYIILEVHRRWLSMTAVDKLWCGCKPPQKMEMEDIRSKIKDITNFILAARLTWCGVVCYGVVYLVCLPVLLPMAL